MVREYRLDGRSGQIVELPICSTILGVGVVDDEIKLWVDVKPSLMFEDVEILVLKTGETTEKEVGQYIGTIRRDSTKHVFTRGKQ